LRASLALLFALAGAAALCAADAPDDLDLREQKAFRAAVDRVAESVVRIETVGGLERVSKVLFGTGPTTGLVIDKDGYIVSSAFNFVNKPTSILVRLPDGARKPAELVATDHNRMIALLRVRADKPLAAVEPAPERELRVGQWAIAVGRTFEGDAPNTTVGVVSALGRIWGKAIQTDAILSPNNYGGPLVDLRGRAMGLIVPLAPDSAEEVAGVEWYDSGIGFAVPVEFIQQLLPRLKQGKDLFPGVIGINLSGNMQVGEATIGACQPGSPAAEAGLKQGDKIVEIDGKPVARAADVKREIARRYAGDKLRVAVLRGKERIDREIEMVAKLEPFQHPFLGVLPLREGQQGVTARYVYPGSPAASAGLKSGDVLLTLGGQPIKGRNELREELGGRKLGEEVEIEFRSGAKTSKAQLKLAALPDALPPPELPPARKAARPAAGERPKVGNLTLNVAEFKNEAAAYVPDDYDPDVPHGLVVWLHGPGGFKADELLAQWKPLCDRYDLILLAPKAADPQKWVPTELAFVQKLVEQVRSSYDIDPLRIVACGNDSGGMLAWMFSMRSRDVVRAVAAVDAAPAGRPAAVEPLHRFAVYLATAKKSAKAREIEAAVQHLKSVKIPLTVKPLGDDARNLNPDELAELARWIDMLDRI
jgi:serine protease Do